MKIKKALITAAGPSQRELPLQTLIDKDRKKRTVLEILVNEIQSAGIEEIGIVVQKADVNRFEEVIEASSISGVQFIPQSEKKGYGHALLSGAEFINNQPFLHLVGDHLYVNRSGDNVTKQLVEMAEKQNCSISTVQPTRENAIGNYGTIKAERIQGDTNIFQIKKVKEKPTPTYAEQNLMVSGLRAGYYLCFYGMHVFTPVLLELLEKRAKEFPDEKLGLSESLNDLAQKSKYLAIEQNNIRYDIGLDYGLLKAQLALSLSGQDRDYLMSELLQFFVEKDLKNKGVS
ncbi:sugar phosphate nucleotidyltransferase [uncultured Draconibacterium sp.]|uniref:sugar phosphate nucleotidyltransferase n=1 Tax=uncultured Draconibacterium sp. TaxID=1573823 RepID=UPI00321764D7